MTNTISLINILNSIHTVSEEDRVNYFPNCDAKVWIRSCTNPVHTPIEGKTFGIIIMIQLIITLMNDLFEGTVPSWLQGQLVRNGPGRMEVGPDKFNHIFDGSALMHR